MQLVALVLILLLARVTSSSPVEKRQAIPASCTNITIPVTVSTSQNWALPINLDTENFSFLLAPLLSGITSLLSSLFDDIVSGTFDIAATYCEPVNSVLGRENTLQVLVHGITYTKAYWFGLYYAPEYSWVSYASSHGYPTLTIDRLGNGESSHPNPILDVQTPLQVEILHQLIVQARSGSLPIVGRSFDSIIVAGHSYGSIITNGFNFKYPADADATILTGFGPDIDFALIGFLVQSELLPAALEDPRYKGYAAGYLEIGSEPYMMYFFYDPGQYDQNLADLDYYTRGTVTLGEAATAVTGTLIAGEYTGPVLDITGLHDAPFCGTWTLAIDLPPLLSTPTCNTSPGGQISSTQYYYPSAKNFTVYYPDAGHCWHLHYVAEATFGVAHDWLTDQGF